MSDELDRLAELEAKATPGPWLHGVQDTGGQAISAGAWGWILKSTMPAINAAHDVVFVCKLRNAAPALLAAARDVDRIVKDYVAQARVASDALREANELREWQREAAFILRFAANGHARAISRADALALLARVKP